MVGIPVCNTGKGRFLHELLRVQTEALGLQAVTAGGPEDIRRLCPVTPDAAVPAQLLQAHPSSVISKDHPQAGSPAINRLLHLHDQRNFFDGTI